MLNYQKNKNTLHREIVSATNMLMIFNNYHISQYFETPPPWLVRPSAT